MNRIIGGVIITAMLALEIAVLVWMVVAPADARGALPAGVPPA